MARIRRLNVLSLRRAFSSLAVLSCIPTCSKSADSVPHVRDHSRHARAESTTIGKTYARLSATRSGFEPAHQSYIDPALDTWRRFADRRNRLLNGYAIRNTSL